MNVNSLKEDLENISKSTKQLNLLSDQATEYIKAIDFFCKNHHVGIVCWADNDIDFGFGKCENKTWGLIFKKRTSGGGYSIDRLAVAPRNKKIESIRYLPLIIARIAVELRATVVSLGMDIKQAERSIQGLNVAFKKE